MEAQVEHCWYQKQEVVVVGSYRSQEGKLCHFRSHKPERSVSFTTLVLKADYNGVGTQLNSGLRKYEIIESGFDRRE